ncbi:hypothetical protein [Duganella sp. HH101]|uniref:hypothetical protein n=1 Tax=Duganella sp. HH101 TaxID=1781066 RepID=UPI000873F54B|nr:hypothetical protein [Duganella sp. HH101]OFA00856.1 hypothetical protein DUGA2_46120 [Duganella sp. HH101]
MNKKLIVPAAMLGMLVCLAGCRDKPAPAAPTPRVTAASQEPVGVHAPQPEGGSDGEEVEVTHTLKGNDFLLEVISSGSNGYPPQTLRATVEETTRDAQPLIVYRVKAGKLAERTIEFRWNGKLFEDTSGEYAKITAAYNP